MKYNVNVHKKEKGFTLLEILLVIAAIGILAAIVIVAINPTQQLGKARNAERQSEVNTISNAIYQYFIDEGVFPGGLNTASALTDLDISTINLNDGTDIVTGACGLTVTATSTNYVNLSSLTPDYIGSLPTDPSNPTDNLATSGQVTEAGALTPAQTVVSGNPICTGYTVSKETTLSGRITVEAPLVELGETISILR